MTDKEQQDDRAEADAMDLLVMAALKVRAQIPGEHARSARSLLRDVGNGPCSIMISRRSLDRFVEAADAFLSSKDSHND